MEAPEKTNLNQTMEKKYELIPSDKEILFRIKALKSFSNVKVGDIGGYVRSEENLSQGGECWIYGDAEVRDDAVVCGNAKVYDNAVVCGRSRVCGSAEVCDAAEVCDNAEVCGNATIGEDAIIRGNEDYIVFKNWWSSGRYFTWTRSNNRWSVGCFYGSGEELIEKAYRDSKKSGREYERVVKYVESILNSEK